MYEIFRKCTGHRHMIIALFASLCSDIFALVVNIGLAQDAVRDPNTPVSLPANF
jgi:hypothetical protein